MGKCMFKFEMLDFIWHWQHLLHWLFLDFECANWFTISSKSRPLTSSCSMAKRESAESRVCDIVVGESISCSCLTLWLASANNRASASDTVSRLKLELRLTSLLHCNRSSLFKLDLIERATTLEIKHKPAQMAAANLFLNESHATGNVSLLAR